MLQRKAQMLEILGRRRGTGVLALLVSVVAMLAMSQAAQAGTLSRNGSNVVVFTATTGETNNIDVFQSGGAYFIFDKNQNPTDSGSGCFDYYTPYGIPYWYCNVVAGFEIHLGDMNDQITPGQYCCAHPDVPITVFGGTGNDTITGAFVGDTLNGEAGDDTLKGGSGADTLSGGDGADDTVDYGDRSAPLNVSIDSSGFGAGPDGEVGENDNTGSAIENIIGGSGNDTLSGNAAQNTISGNGGNDTIRGGKQTDQLSGGAGTNTIDYQDRSAAEGVSVTLDGVANDGQAGENDNIGATFQNITGGPGPDFLAGNDSVNTISGMAGDDTIMGRKGTDVLSGGDGGGDVIDYSYFTAAESATVSLDNVINEPEGENIGSAFEGISGGAGIDTLIGNDGANTIRGGGGNDTIDPKGGGDAVFGDAGDDSISTTDGVVDGVDCGAGTDTNNADSGDNRVNCELPAPAQPAPPVQPIPPTIPPTVPPVVKPPKTMAVTVSYGYIPKFPKKNTTFFAFTAKNVPKGSKVVARCVNAKGKKCRGKLGNSATIKKTTKKTLALKVFNRKYPAGSALEVIVSKSGYRTQIKIVQVRKNKIPNIVTRCQTPGSAKRTSC